MTIRYCPGAQMRKLAINLAYYGRTIFTCRLNGFLHVSKEFLNIQSHKQALFNFEKVSDALKYDISFP